MPQCGNADVVMALLKSGRAAPQDLSENTHQVLLPLVAGRLREGWSVCNPTDRVLSHGRPWLWSGASPLATAARGAPKSYTIVAAASPSIRRRDRTKRGGGTSRIEFQSSRTCS